MQTEQELTTAVGIASDGDNSSGRLRAKKKLQEQSKKLQEQSKKLQEQSKKLQAKFTSSNPGLEGRELSLFTLVVLGCIVFLLYTIVQNIAGLLRAQNDPATSLSYETTLTYPSFALLVCPNFLVNQRYWAPGGKETLRIVPHLEIFQQRGEKRGGSSSNKFTSSEGNKLFGTEFPFIPLNETNKQTTTLVEPKPIDMAFYQKTAINCLALSPNGITNSIDSGNLRLSMDYVNQHLDQDQIATLTVGMYCMVSRDGGEFVRDNTMCPADTPLLISAFSTEEGDFDKQQDLVWNFKHPCRKSPPNFCPGGKPCLGATTQVPAQRKGILSLEATETRPPTDDLFSIEGSTKPHFTHELQFVDVGPGQNDATRHATTYTLYVSAAIAKQQRRVVQMYYTTTTNSVITAVSGLLSLLLLIVNSMFPKIDQSERVPPMLVRHSHSVLKRVLWCRCIASEKGGGEKAEGKEKEKEGTEEMKVEVENPIVDA